MDAQKAFWDKNYSAAIGDGSDLEQRLEGIGTHSRVGRAAELLRECTGTLLDVGCGIGPLFYKTHSQFTKLIGFDISTAQLDQAKIWSTKRSLNMELFEWNIDIADPPIPAGSVDAISCLAVLEVVHYPEEVLKRMSNLLRPNGVFVASVGNIVSWKNRLRVLAGCHPRTTTFQGLVDGGALHTYTKDTFCTLLKQFGLVPDYVGCSGRYWNIRQFWPSLLGGDIVVRARKC